MYQVLRQVRTKANSVRLLAGRCVQKTPLRCNNRFLSDSTFGLNASSDENIVNCPYGDTFIPESDIYSHVFQQFPKLGKKIALIDGITGREYSYNEVQESVVNMASGLVRSGMEKGDVLALVSPNSAQFCTTFFSTLAMGGIISTCNPQYTAEELAYQFKNSNSKYVATIPALLPTIKEAASKSGCVEKVIMLSDDGGIGEGKDIISYQSLVRDTGSRFPLNIGISPKEDIGVLPYSSGTTGLAKGVMLTHSNIVANLVQAKHPQFVDFSSPDSCVLGVLPYFHIYGMVSILCMCLYQGTKLVVLPKFDPVQFLSCLQIHEVTDAVVVPPLALFLAKHPMVESYNISTLRHMMSAAAPLDGEVSMQAKNRVGAKVLRQGYGLTELSPLCHLCPMDVDDPYTIGIPLLNTQVKIADVDSGKALGPHSQGEVAVKGPQVMKGYFSLPAEAAGIKDGWLFTGDLGYYDQNGHFYITDRLKEMIKVKGFQVAPAELEALLLQHPHIADVAVVGVDDERSGELPRAFVVRSSDDLTEQQIQDYVKGQVAEYKQLKGGVKFIREIPKSASGKIQRRLLKNN